MSRSDFVSVTIVTYNSGRFIKRCLESVLDQNYPFKEIIVIDNNSSDGTIDILEPFEDRCRIVYNEENIGFAAAQNQAISLSGAEWVLTLNPDVLLLQGFLEALVTAGNLDPRVGTVCGKLLTMTATFDFPEEPLVDSTGIYFTPNLRHLDRGSLEPQRPKLRHGTAHRGGASAGNRSTDNLQRIRPCRRWKLRGWSLSGSLLLFVALRRCERDTSKSGGESAMGEPFATLRANVPTLRICGEPKRMTSR